MATTFLEVANRPLPSTPVTADSTRSRKAAASNRVDAAGEKQLAVLLRSVKACRMTDSHIFFRGGPLSNWNQGKTYSGKRCLELMVPELDELGVKHPALDAFSNRLLESYAFNCGEQWMMAMKAWLFEDFYKLGETVVNEQDFQKLRTEMLSSTCRAARGSDNHEFYYGTLCNVLRSKSPKEHKSFGRKAKNYDESVWQKASVPTVVACSVARAEADGQLAAIYRWGGRRKFVEGSPVDRVWGVGIKWDQPEIEDETRWRGENRLGRCHDAARDVFLELEDAKRNEKK